MLHAAGLPDGFFAQLGTRFLRRYHRSFRRSPQGVLIVVGRPGAPTGFLAGTLDNECHYSWVARHEVAGLAVSGLVALLTRPRLLAEFARTRSGRYARWLVARLRAARPRPATAGTTDRGTRRPERRIAVLAHVVVDERHRGVGTGRELVGSFVERARGAGASEARLITAETLEASDFYRSLGWRSHGTRTGADGTVVEEFRIAF
jgi:GNAT superfamily N-acetyltransferase